jgi:S1-C subfamily serine protease
MSEPSLGKRLSSELVDAVASASRSLVTTIGRRGRHASGTLVGDGLAVFSDHLLDADDTFPVETPGGGKATARLVGRDPATDLALAKLDGVAGTPVTDASDAVRVGQLVLAIGRVSGAGPVAELSIVAGIFDLSRPRRPGLDVVIDLGMTPFVGFSGGAVVDLDGRALGVSSSALVRGSGAAVPMAAVRQTVATLLEHGRIRRGFLGVTTVPVRLPSFQGGDVSSGTLVTSVADDSPAARARLMVGDVLVKLGEWATATPGDLADALGRATIGAAVPATIVRGASVESVDVTVGERPSRRG